MKGKVSLIAIGALLLLVLIIIGLLYLPDGIRVALRDIAIIFMALISIIGLLLTIVLVTVLIMVTFLIKDKIIPLLEQLTQTVARVRGTTEFVSEEVVEPIIHAAGAIARVRAMTRTAVGKDK